MSFPSSSLVQASLHSPGEGGRLVIPTILYVLSVDHVGPHVDLVKHTVSWAGFGLGQIAGGATSKNEYRSLHNYKAVHLPVTKCTLGRAP